MATKKQMAEWARQDALTPAQLAAEQATRLAALDPGKLEARLSDMERSQAAIVAPVERLTREEAAQQAEDLGYYAEAERIRAGGKF